MCRTVRGSFKNGGAVRRQIGVARGARDRALAVARTADARFQGGPSGPLFVCGDVRFWLLADIPVYVDLCPLLGVKRT